MSKMKFKPTRVQKDLVRKVQQDLCKHIEMTATLLMGEGLSSKQAVSMTSIGLWYMGAVAISGVLTDKQRTKMDKRMAKVIKFANTIVEDMTISEQGISDLDD